RAEDAEAEHHRRLDGPEPETPDPGRDTGGGGEGGQRERQHLPSRPPERPGRALGGRRRHPSHATGGFRGLPRHRSPTGHQSTGRRTPNELSGTREEQPKFTVLDEVHRPSPGRSPESTRPMSNYWRQYARCLGADPELFYPPAE